MRKPRERPLISFVVIGRNDDYMGDYLYRLGTSLSFLAESASVTGFADALEIVVVDWASAVPLSAVLPLTPEARQLVRFIQVPASAAFGRFGSDRLMPTVAVNVGVRRALGDFIFFTDSDCLWTSSAVAALERLLTGRYQLPAPLRHIIGCVRRSQVSWSAAHRRPTLAEWRRLTLLLAAGIRPEQTAASSLGGFTAGQLMHRDLWFEVRGYDESLDRPWGWSDNDLMLRVTQRHAWADVSADGFLGLHLEHWPTTERRSARDASSVNPMRVHYSDAPNGDTWGLGDLRLEAVLGTGPEPDAGTGCGVPLTGRMLASDGAAWSPGADAVGLLQSLGADREASGLTTNGLAWLAEHAQADLPRTLYWFGDVDPGALLILLRICPAAELFMVNPWPEGVTDAHPMNPATFAHFMGSRCQFRGWSRIVTGPLSTALARIDQSSLGHGPIELAWLGSVGDVDVLSAVAEHLAPGGVMIFAGSDDEERHLESLADVGHICRPVGTGLTVLTRRTDGATEGH